MAGIKQYSAELADFNQQQLDQIEQGVAAVNLAVENVNASVGRVENVVDVIKSTDLSNVKTDIAGVKTDVGTVKTNVSSVKTVVDAIRATDVAQIKTDVAGVKTEVQGKLWWDKYTQRIFRSRSITVPAQGQVEAINVTGKGYFTMIIACLKSGSQIFMDIVKDGATLKTFSFTNDNTYMGYAPLLVNTNSTYNGLSFGGKVGNLNAGESGYIIINQPIYFNTSLKVVLRTDFTGAGDVGFGCEVGVL